MDDITYLIEAVHSVINALDRLRDSGDVSTDFQPVVSKLDYLQRMVVGLDIDDSVTEMVGAAFKMLSDIEKKNQVQCASYKATLIKNGWRGRPSYEINEEQISFLLEQNFPLSDISNILGVSVRTVKRRMSHFGLSVKGKSTHNQRIERLWRDVFSGCLSLFYNLFHSLEGQGILNPDDESHLWCLHYVFLPIINRHLINWKNAWIHHPLRTEKSKSPMQLWIRGLHEACGLQAFDNENFQEYPCNYGIDWQGPIPEQHPDSVEVPDTNCPFTEDQINVLPNTYDMNYLAGVDAFTQIKILLIADT